MQRYLRNHDTSRSQWTGRRRSTTNRLINVIDWRLRHIGATRLVMTPDSFIHPSISLSDTFTSVDDVPMKLGDQSFSDSFTFAETKTLTASITSSTAGAEFLADRLINEFNAPTLYKEHAIHPLDYEHNAPIGKYEFLAPESEDSE